MKRGRTFSSGRSGNTKKRRVMSQKARITKLLGNEAKYVDSERTAISPVSQTIGSEIDNTTMLCLNGIANGTTESTRIGTKVVLTSIQISGLATMLTQSDQADAEPSTSVRILLVHDKQTNGAQFNGEDVLLNSSVDILAFRDPEYSARFTVLKEWFIELNATNSQTDGTNTGSIAGEQKRFTLYKKLNIPVKYSADNATVTAIVDNSLHLMAIQTSTGGPVQLNWQSRVRYQDS